MDDWALSDPLKKGYSHFECGIYLIKNGSPVNGAWIKDLPNEDSPELCMRIGSYLTGPTRPKQGSLVH